MIILSFIGLAYMHYVLAYVTWCLLSNKKKLVITVDGNIGSGKSTLLKLLGENTDYKILLEPSAEWKEIGAMDKYYYDQKRHAYEFQSFVLTTHDKHIQNALSQSDTVITERCPETHKAVFFQMLADKSYFDIVQKKMYDILYGCSVTRADAMIYIDSDVELSYSRLMARGRPEEMYIKKTYLQSVHDMHTHWVEDWSRPVMTVSGQDFKINSAKVLGEIKEFIEILR